MKAGDRLTIDVNQGQRPAQVLAVLGDAALIEYTMPNGTTALRIVQGNSYRAVGYWDLSLKWLVAVLDQGQGWEANPQQNGGRELPSVEGMVEMRQTRLVTK